MTEIKKLGRVTTESVLKCTGKNWNTWVALLDKAGAQKWSHQECVAFLRKKHKLGPWWEQGVAMGYEIHHGKREEGKNLKGEHSTAVTRTIPISNASVWKKLISSSGIAVWLEPIGTFKLKTGEVFETKAGAYGTVGTIKGKPGRVQRLRLKWLESGWSKATAVEVHVVRREAQKSILAFQHLGIRDRETHSKLKAYWVNKIESFVAICKED